MRSVIRIPCYMKWSIKPDREDTGFHTPSVRFHSPLIVVEKSILTILCANSYLQHLRWHDIPRILQRSEAVVHPQDMRITEVDTHGQDPAQNHEVEAEVEKEVEAENATSTLR